MLSVKVQIIEIFSKNFFFGELNDFCSKNKITELGECQFCKHVITWIFISGNARTYVLIIKTN